MAQLGPGGRLEQVHRPGHGVAGRARGSLAFTTEREHDRDALWRPRRWSPWGCVGSRRPARSLRGTESGGAGYHPPVGWTFFYMFM